MLSLYFIHYLPKIPFHSFYLYGGNTSCLRSKITDINDNNYQWIGSETESVLDGAQKNGVNIPYACKGGGCGLCKVRVEEGEFERGRSSIAVLPNDERDP